MSDTLRDQLLALGFTRSKPEPKEQRNDKPRGAPPHGKGKPPHDAKRHGQHARNDQRGPKKQGPGSDQKPKSEVDLAQAYAARARSEREAKEREQREQQERARLKKERREKLAKLLDGKALNAKDADVARNFPHGDKIRRVYVTADQLAQLNKGELGVVQVAGRYLLVTKDVAVEAKAIDEAALVLLPDPNAPAEDDVPPDLVW